MELTVRGTARCGGRGDASAVVGTTGKGGESDESFRHRHTCRLKVVVPVVVVEVVVVAVFPAVAATPVVGSVSGKGSGSRILAAAW